jgi:GTP-binding protein
MSTFVDQVTITVRSGDGGNGMIAWRREKYEPLGGPAGGDGGRRGDVLLEADQQLSTLLDFRYKSRYDAQRGAKGGPKNKYGKSADPFVIKVPVGTVVRDSENGAVIADLARDGQNVLVAEGGLGGRGNTKLVSPTRRAPHFCEPGQPGIERKLELELKLLADVGVIGVPNAGKSSLLALMTAARPKIADYPFSTLQPNLGVVKLPGGDGYVMADIPGLVEGAANGTGLGHKFLRHVERTRLLIHLADLSSEDLERNIKIINQELALYSQTLSSLPQILVLNKADLLDEAAKQTAFAEIKAKYRSLMPAGIRLEADSPLLISCGTREGLEKLSAQIALSLSRLDKKPVLYEIEEDPKALQRPDSTFSIERHKKVFNVVSDRVDRLVEVTNLRDPESVFHLHHVLKAMGVITALLAEGAKPGSDVVIGGVTFAFGEDW